jgi:sialate O-acetylesterase
VSVVAGARANLQFSSVFGDHAVLQRATRTAPTMRAALYGDGALAGEAVTVKLSPADGGSGGKSSASAELFSTTAGADGTWKVLLSPKPAGGDFTAVVASSLPSSSSGSATLKWLTFGDVWLCSGQSNMELNLHFTFEKNDTYAAVGQGKYKNIRIFHLNHNPMPYRKSAWVLNTSAVMTNWTVADESSVINRGQGDQCPPDPENHNRQSCTQLDQFSAACWYFAQKLTDRFVAEAAAEQAASAPATAAAAVVPLGMIESAWGGTTIEQWLSVDAQLRCSNISCHSNSSIPYTAASAEQCTQDAEQGNGGLWGGMISPFLNMTVTGWT